MDGPARIDLIASEWVDPLACAGESYVTVAVEYQYVLDCNANEISDRCDIADGTSLDCNENDVPDECEADCNANGVADSCDIAAGTSGDCGSNGLPDECEPDCNGNGFADSCDLSEERSADCDYNFVPDECDIADGTWDDCDDNLPKIGRPALSAVS